MPGARHIVGADDSACFPAGSFMASGRAVAARPVAGGAVDAGMPVAAGGAVVAGVPVASGRAVIAGNGVAARAAGQEALPSGTLHAPFAIDAALREVRACHARDVASAAAQVLGMLSMRSALRSRRRILWVRDPACAREAGGLSPDGLEALGFSPASLTLVTPRDIKGALWAADQAARCRDLSGIVLQLRGHPSRYDLTASRRLALRARSFGVPLFVLRVSGGEEASAAVARWRAAPAPSAPNPLHPRGVGPPRLDLTLERNRNGPSGRWLAAWNPAKGSFDHDGCLPPANEDAPAEDHGGAFSPPADGPDRADEVGHVVAFKGAP